VLAGNNEQKALKIIFRRHKDTERSIANSTQCNDMHLANFAQRYNANLTFDYLKKYTWKHNLDKATKITIQDIASQVTENKSEEEIILVYVGR